MPKAPNRPTPFAKRSFGQNFLVDSTFIEKIVDSAHLSSDDTVVEIGPGRGALTVKLVERAGQVIAIELDTDLAPILRDRFRGTTNFQLIEADILKQELSSLLVGKKAKVIANLPYYISTAVLQYLIEQRSFVSEMVLMFQREVVDRIVAGPGNSARGYLTVLVEAFMDIEKLFDVPPSAFKPAPKVWSSVIRLAPKVTDPRLLSQEKQFASLVSASFRQKRKTILNNLKAASNELNIHDPVSLLTVSGIEPTRRAETLNIEEWAQIFTNYVG